MGFARLQEGTWAEYPLQDLEGNPFDGSSILGPIVKTVCFDGMNTGLYVLTDDDDNYFTCHSIDLEFIDDIRVLHMLRFHTESTQKLREIMDTIPQLQTPENGYFKY